MGAHLNRWLTGLLVLPGILLLIGYGSAFHFSLLISVVAILALMEYYRMVMGPGCQGEKVLGLAVSLGLVLAAQRGDQALLLAILSLTVPVVFIGGLWRGSSRTFDVITVVAVAAGVFYITLGLAHFIFLRKLPSGTIWVFFVLTLAFAGDTAAFYTGSLLGGRKLLPTISPGKTVEGTLGLIGGSTAACLVFKWAFLPGLPWYHAAALGIFGSVIGQLGDLSESALKRHFGLKDSGSLLPGHGGILDRIDCLLFIVPFVYYYRMFILS